jgi:hypothetical protein
MAGGREAHLTLAPRSLADKGFKQLESFVANR